ncbi:MAG TPA: MucR family transcriptional regulator [Candidatus Saccharimonadales bacterium]|nr:MucR family transcriptional regulator [Candidatus Saccharimonadales bacterium]
MDQSIDESNSPCLTATVQVVAAYVGRNALGSGDLPKLIASVYDAFRALEAPAPAEPMPSLIPAVPVRKSATADHIVCLEDGKAFKSLKRHLATAHNLTPEQYRQKWALPSNYPMVASNYSTSRSELAKSLGLGRKPGTTVERRTRRVAAKA